MNDQNREISSHHAPSLNGPGHLVRRAHQIAVAIFLDEFRDTPITPVQYSALICINDNPGMDQNTLASLIAVDRTTIGGVVRVLDKRGFVTRITPADNQRVRRLFILAEGIQFLDRTRHKLVRNRERLLAPLTAEERLSFLTLLGKLVSENNDISRAPMRIKAE